MLSDHIVDLANQVRILLQHIFKSFCYSVSAQAWVKCFHICWHNVNDFFFSFLSFG